MVSVWFFELPLNSSLRVDFEMLFENSLPHLSANNPWKRFSEKQTKEHK